MSKSKQQSSEHDFREEITDIIDKTDVSTFMMTWAIPGQDGISIGTLLGGSANDLALMLLASMRLWPPEMRENFLRDINLHTMQCSDTIH